MEDGYSIVVDSAKRDSPLDQPVTAFDIPMSQTKHWQLFCSGAPQRNNFALSVGLSALICTYPVDTVYSPVVKVVFYETTKKNQFAAVHELTGASTSFRPYLFVAACSDNSFPSFVRRYDASGCRQKLCLQEKSAYRVELYDADDLALDCDRFQMILSVRENGRA